MTRRKSCHLIDMLAKLSDPARIKGNDIYRYLGPLTTSTRFHKEDTPCASTIHNLLKKLDIEALEETLTQWVNTVLEVVRI